MNNPEEAFKQLAADSNWESTKLGWPDFFCWKDGRIVIVEVKPDLGSSELRRTQRVILMGLATFGIPCFRWSPIKGFTRIRGNPDRFIRQLKLSRKEARKEYAKKLRKQFNQKRIENITKNGITDNTINQQLKSWRFINMPLLKDKDLGRGIEKRSK